MSAAEAVSIDTAPIGRFESNPANASGLAHWVRIAGDVVPFAKVHIHEHGKRVRDARLMAAMVLVMNAPELRDALVGLMPYALSRLEDMDGEEGNCDDSAASPELMKARSAWRDALVALESIGIVDRW